MSQTVFLSSVTSEFGQLRRRLANLSQRTKKCQVRHQDDFFHRGVKTLQKLAEEIQESDLVVHLIGSKSGWCVPADQSAAFLDENPKFEERFSAVSQQARKGSIPATQWEAWLGLFYGKRLFGYELQTADRDDLQTAHLQRLSTIEEHPDLAVDLDSLYDEIIGSLITYGIFSVEDAADIRRPVKLPFPSIGTLFKGRDQFLKQLRESLQQSTDHRATAITGKAVHGLGGVGKTRLAVEYAWQHADQYSAVLCVTADSPENMQKNIAELAGPLVLNLAEQTATEEEGSDGDWKALRYKAGCHFVNQYVLEVECENSEVVTDIGVRSNM